MTTKHHDDDDLTLAIEICESSNGTISNMSNPVSAAMRHRDDSLLLMNPTPQTAAIDPQSVKKRMHLRRDSHSSRRTLRSSTMCCGTNSMSAALGMLFLIVGGVLLSCAAVSTVRTVAVIHTAPGAPTTRVLYPYIQIEISKRPNDQSSWFKDSIPAPRTLIAPYYTPPAPPTYPSISFGQDYVPLTTSSSAYRGHCVKPDGTWASGDLFPPYILTTNLNNPEDNATPPAGSASP